MSKPAKAKVYKKESTRDIKLSKSGSAKEAIGTLKQDQDVYILTFGQFSLIDALVEILDQTGPASVGLATWTAADAHLKRTADMIESSQITKFRMIVDRSFEGRQPEYCYHMRKLFGFDCIRSIRTHAKFMLIRNAKWDIVVRTSMNLNENPRLECLEISTQKPFAEFFEAIFEDVFAEVDECQNRSAMLELKNIEDKSIFKECHAGMIKREKLIEPATTHTIKKL